MPISTVATTTSPISCSKFASRPGRIRRSRACPLRSSARNRPRARPAPRFAESPAAGTDHAQAQILRPPRLPAHPGRHRQSARHRSASECAGSPVQAPGCRPQPRGGNPMSRARPRRDAVMASTWCAGSYRSSTSRKGSKYVRHTGCCGDIGGRRSLGNILMLLIVHVISNISQVPHHSYNRTAELFLTAKTLNEIFRRSPIDAPASRDFLRGFAYRLPGFSYCLFRVGRGQQG
jgi:hypothetical protein